jgi:hypothetical protein
LKRRKVFRAYENSKHLETEKPIRTLINMKGTTDQQPVRNPPPPKKTPTMMKTQINPKIL